MPEVGKRNRSRSALSVRHCWLLVLLLAPFLTGGVVVGDEALLLKLVHNLATSPLSFGDYARSPDGWYIPHHILWFALISATAHAAALLHASPLIVEAMISCQTVVAGLAAIALCYTFLIRRLEIGPARSTWITLFFFAGGYGVYCFCQGGVVECFMVLAMSMRLFFAEPESNARDVWKLAIIDAILVSLKAYSIVFLLLTWPLLRASRLMRPAYLLPLAAFLLILGVTKLWLWNSVYNSTLASISVSQSFSNFTQQFISPWTGLLVCLPVLMVLLWHSKSQRTALFFKAAGLCGCAVVFSLYDFFYGDIAGGRYIFPFVVALLPEIATAANHLLDRTPRTAWLLPVAVLAFLPVAALGFPYFPDSAIPNLGPCRPNHPVIYSWKILIAKIDNSKQVEICFHQKRYVLSARDVASPRLGPWRVAYMLEGGHSPGYRATVHDPVQKQHDIWGRRLADRLRSTGLGNLYFWEALGLVPAILVLWLSLLAAIRINRNPRAAADAG